jgi:antitoxin YefM
MYRRLYTCSVAKIVPFTEARSTLSELLDEVNERHEHVVITRKGRPAGVMLSNEEYEALAETLEVLEDDATLDALRESEADVREGRVQPLDEVRRELGLG